MAEAVLIGGPWDGHREEVVLGADGLPPALLPPVPRHDDLHRGHEPHAGADPRRGPITPRPGPADGAGSRWIYEPDLDDPLS